MKDICQVSHVVFCFHCHIRVFNGYTMSKGGLPDMYTQGPMAEGGQTDISDKPLVHMI